MKDFISVVTEVLCRDEESFRPFDDGKGKGLFRLQENPGSKVLWRGDEIEATGTFQSIEGPCTETMVPFQEMGSMAEEKKVMEG